MILSGSFPSETWKTYTHVHIITNAQMPVHKVGFFHEI